MPSDSTYSTSPLRNQSEINLASNTYITCPYDNSHRLLPTRLSLHLVKCARNHRNSKLLRCPFNNDHRLKNSDLQNHIRECPNRRDFDRFVQPDALPPEEPRPSTVELVKSSENWDDETPLNSYKPNAHNEKNGILRKIDGASRKERREFREAERRRFREMN